ncbi:methyltransferase domain-containing protein [Planosporangium flavigriseum]|uniref:Methyltransferase n=1 Tax=Planosporangium flavigriseum TaxID=373681 RepID=A0A8J3LW67_9ACTN|nr:methyltransferase [Planosporangium flavigriseum]NJC66234.1 methyltransferase domain-containing protein [Planosporangium flavigriseum]GIG74691.1 methyltransferase [Planosporangium flavigriseum]
MTTANTWTPTGDDLAAAYARHADSLRGALRHALVTRALLTHLPAAPQHVVDVGGGAGHQAIALARAGHTVTVIDPDAAMLQRAADALNAEGDEVAARVTLRQGFGEHARDILGDEPADAVCCHGVLMYVDDPAPLLGALVDTVRPGGLISVLVKNRAALAMRPGLEGRWADALAVIDQATETGGLGLPSRADDLDTIQRTLAAAGAVTEAWYGVRVFTDHLGNTPVGADFDQILAAEWAAGARDPYRSVARLFHLIARRSA